MTWAQEESERDVNLYADSTDEPASEPASKRRWF